MNIESKQYSLPFLFAVCFHITVLAFLLFELSLPVRSASSAVTGNIVHAVAISQQTVDNYEQAIAAAKQAQVAAQQAALRQQQEAQQQAELKAQQLKQQQLKQQQIQTQKAQAIAAAKQKAAQAAEQKATEQAAAAKAAQQAAKVTAAKATQQAQAKKLQQALKQDLQNELNNDQSELNQNAAALQKNQGVIDKYKTLIIQAVSQQWIVPQNLPNNISCELDVRVAPGGAVIQVSVLKSSGNVVFDNSAVAAVNKASPLPVPTDLGNFDQFRELHFTVKPDGTLTST